MIVMLFIVIHVLQVHLVVIAPGSTCVRIGYLVVDCKFGGHSQRELVCWDRNLFS